MGLGSTNISGFSPLARKEVSPKVGNADNEQFMRSKKIKVNEDSNMLRLTLVSVLGAFATGM